MPFHDLLGREVDLAAVGALVIEHQVYVVCGVRVAQDGRFRGLEHGEGTFRHSMVIGHPGGCQELESGQASGQQETCGPECRIPFVGTVLVGLIPQQARHYDAYGVGGHTVFAELPYNPFLEYEEPDCGTQYGSAKYKEKLPDNRGELPVLDKVQT